MSEIDCDPGPCFDAERGSTVGGTHREEVVGRDDVTRARLATSDAADLPELLERIDTNVRVRADRDRDPALEKLADLRETVTEVRLRGGTQADACPCLGDELQLGLGRVRGMDDRRPLR
jgi:hypothetical protein